jgi:hypothetical protein
LNNIRVKRYKNIPEWQGFIEPEDLSWVIFISKEGHVFLYDKRDPVTGAVLD